MKSIGGRRPARYTSRVEVLMKRMLVLFGIVVLLAAGGCSQSSVDAKDDTVRFPQYEAPNFPPYSTDNVFSH